MRNVRLWRALLGVDKRTVIEGIEFEEFEEEDADGGTVVVARVWPRSGVSRRCGRCGRRACGYDRGYGPGKSCAANDSSRPHQRFPRRNLAPQKIRPLPAARHHLLPSEDCDGELAGHLTRNPRQKIPCPPRTTRMPFPRLRAMHRATNISDWPSDTHVCEWQAPPPGWTVQLVRTSGVDRMPIESGA